MAYEFRPIPRLVPGTYPLTNVTPFTYRDGVTYERLLYTIIEKLNATIVDFNDQNTQLYENIVEQLNDTIDSVNAALGEQTAEVDQKLADLTLYVDNTVATIVDMRDEMETFRDETEAFRDQAETFSATTVELQDAAVAALIDTPGSETQAELDATIALPGYIYVSPDGDDANEGTVPGRPKATIAAAIDALPAQGGHIDLGVGKTHILTEGFSVDVTKVSLAGERAVLDFSGLPDGEVAITAFGSEPQPLFQPWLWLRGVEMMGPSRTGSAVGIRYETPSNPGKAAAAHIACSNVSIHEFGIGIDVFSGAYALTHDSIQVARAQICVRMLNGGNNYGERISFTNSTLFNSVTAFDLANPNGEVFFTNGSIDYVHQVAVLSSSRLNIIAAHVELDLDKGVAPVSISGNAGTLVMLGGTFSSTLPVGEITAPAIVENNASAHSRTIFRDVNMHNIATPSGVFATGTGTTVVEGEITRGGSSRSFDVLSDAMNVLIDGSFAQSTVVDDWYIFNDASTPSERTLVGTNGNAQLSNAQVFEGADKSLMFTKTVATSQPLIFHLMVPVPFRGALPHWSMRCFTESGGGTANVSVFAAAIHDDSTYPEIKRLVQQGGTMPIPANGLVWDRARQGVPWPRLPAWATHFIVRVSLTGMATDSKFYVGPTHISFS